MHSKFQNKDINAGSIADIAFLLLIFFLVATTIETDEGILRKLPPLPKDQKSTSQVLDRNVFVVQINAFDGLQVEGELMDINQLKDGTREFLTNPDNRDDLPEKKRITRAEVTERIAYYKGLTGTEEGMKTYGNELEKWEKRLTTINLIGEYNELPSSAVISLRNDTQTSYDMYIQVQNELTRAINELRNELSEQKFGKLYDELDKNNEEEKQMILAVRQVYPQRISEAEPNVSND
jgi:biopolymer transport protein ExbD